MRVTKRNGASENIMFDKITTRLTRLVEKQPTLCGVNVILVAQKVIQGIYDGVTTSALDNLAAETAVYMTTTHPDYETLALRIVVSNLHKETTSNYFELCDALYSHIDPITKIHKPLISEEVFTICSKNIDFFNELLDYEKDYEYGYFGYKTLEKSYLLKINKKIAERPQHLLLRVAIGIHGNNLKKIKQTYRDMSDKYYTHATPTLFNAGTPNPQMASCFLMKMKNDSIEGIYDTLKECALVSKSAGGIGLSIHDIRAKGSYIHGTNGISNGIVPMLRVFNETARYVDQGGGKRKGSFAVYLEPWHADIEDFLELKNNTGKEEYRARDLFYGLWIPDIFMERVSSGGNWNLFCPNECPGLADVWGDEFNALYKSYENSGRSRKTLPAQELWGKIITSQIETGTPYMLYKDACNEKSNQNNLGTIRSSNLCTEIIEYTAPDEVAVCNLASVSLAMFLRDGNFDHNKLYDIVYQVTENLNQIIDRNYYPIATAQRSNMNHRPIGVGVQGLADLFFMMKIDFDSPRAKQLNKEIFETMYYAAATASCDLAKKYGHYSTFPGSLASRGILCPDMWKIKPSNRWCFDVLRNQIKEHGMRNSLLLAPMPTASTSNILGNNECFEPITSNIYTRKVLAGEFIIINKYLVKDLMEMNMWNETLKNDIIEHNGSIQNVEGISDDMKRLYRTVWEMKMKDIIDMSADRGAFICQSQSLNLFMKTPTKQKITSMHFYAWSKGLKTGMYYLRTQAAADAIKFTIPTPKEKEIIVAEVCTMEPGCHNCGS